MSRPAGPLWVRISWAPAAAPLHLAALECCGQPLCAQVVLPGGAGEFLCRAEDVPERARLRWSISATPGTAVDDIRIEVGDGTGPWHLLGELLGGGDVPKVWMAERHFKSGPHRVLPPPGVPLWQDAAAV